MKISAQEEYGLRCLLQLARAESEGETLTLSQIARRGNRIARVIRVCSTLVCILAIVAFAR